MRYIFYILLIFVACNINGQDKSVLYSQYFFNGLAINPAFTGSNEVFTVSISTRNQWIGHEGAPNTQTLSTHTPLKNTKIAIGFILAHEKIGARDYYSSFLNYAYRIRMSTGKLSLGLKAGIITGNLNILDLDYDPAFNSSTPRYLMPNFGVGCYYSANRFYAGFSIPFVLGYQDGGENTGIKAYHDLKKYSYYLTSAYTFYLSNSWQIQPAFLMNYELSLKYNLDLTLNTTYMNIIRGGITYRTNKSLILLFDYKISYQFRAGFAYDFGFGEINEYNHSAFELFLQYEFGYRVKVPDLRDF
jgi:type IX secretion system PorP/SprF family membrane protein